MKIVISMILAASFVLMAAPSSSQPLASEVSVSCSGMRVSVCPRSDFEFIRNACGGDDDYIEIWVRDWGGNGIPGIPPTDYWIDSCDESADFQLCYFFIEADSVTSGRSGFEGRTTISGRVMGGGCVLSGGIKLAVQGQIVVDETWVNPICLDIQIVSPDIDGDLDVDLSDLGIFGTSLNRSAGHPEYNDCCDFNDDGQVNLSDFAFMGMHYQHGCM